MISILLAMFCAAMGVSVLAAVLGVLFAGWLLRRGEPQPAPFVPPPWHCARCGLIMRPGDVHGRTCCTVLVDGAIRQFTHPDTTAWPTIFRNYGETS